MTRKPNAFQKLMHRVFMLRPVTEFFASRANRIDYAILRLTQGKRTGSEIMGWDIIQLTTLGAKSGEPRTLPLVALFEDEKIALIASSFGRVQNPGWYYNLKAHPDCKVQFINRSRKYIAHKAEGDEYKKYWQLAVEYYAGYEKYKARAGRQIPVMVLEPKN